MKKFIVTGASKGIGKATVLSLVERGHTVIAVARSEHLLKELHSESQKKNILTVCADLSTIAGIEKVMKTTQSLNGIDGLINNAATLINKPFSDLTIEDWRHQFDQNFFSIIRLIKSLLSEFSPNAHIVNIGSMSGYHEAQKFAGLSAYGASKAALSNLTEYLALELVSVPIHVNCLALGAVSTEMQQQAFPTFKPTVTAERMGKFIAEFILNNGQLFNGKVIPVALNNPS